MNTEEENITEEEENITEEEDNEEDSEEEKYPLKQYHNNLLKLVHLLEEECIDETQLKDIIINLKNKANQITWTREHEYVLKELAEKCSCYVFLHTRSYKYFALVHIQFTMPMFIITLLSSFFMFMSTNYHMDYFGIIAGSVNLLVATLQKIMEFIQPERFKIEHQSSAKAFLSLSENIRIQLSLHQDERDPMPMYLTKTINDFTVAWQNAPQIRDSIIREFTQKFKRNDIYTPQEIGGIRSVNVYEPSYDERNIIISKSLSQKKKNKNTSKSLNIINDQNIVI